MNYQELEAKKSQKAKTSKKDKGAKLAEELNLTEEQATKVEAIYQTYNPQIKSLKANKTLSEEDKTAQIKALKDKKKDELKEVLTADQYKKKKALKKAYSSTIFVTIKKLILKLNTKLSLTPPVSQQLQLHFYTSKVSGAIKACTTLSS